MQTEFSKKTKKDFAVLYWSMSPMRTAGVFRSAFCTEAVAWVNCKSKYTFAIHPFNFTTHISVSFQLPRLEKNKIRCILKSILFIKTGSVPCYRFLQPCCSSPSAERRLCSRTGKTAWRSGSDTSHASPHAFAASSGQRLLSSVRRGKRNASFRQFHSRSTVSPHSSSCRSARSASSRRLMRSAILKDMRTDGRDISGSSSTRRLGR